MLRIFAFLIVSQSVFASSWQAAYLFDFYSTEANYNTLEEEESLGTGKFYELYTQRLDLYYRYNKNWRVLIGSELNYARSSDNLDERSNFLPNNLNLGAEWGMRTKYGNFSIGNNNYFSLFNVDANTDEALVGEGASLIHLYGMYQLQIGNRLGLHTKIGYMSRTDGRSDLSTYEANLRLITMPLILAIGVEAYTSITDDELVNSQITRDNVTENVNGGSYHFYSVNPSRMDLVLWGNYAFSESVAARIGYKSSLSGNNTSKGSSIFFNFYVNFGGNDFANEALGMNGYSIDEFGDFKILADEYKEEKYFEKPKKKKRRRRIRRPRRKKLKSIEDDI